MERAIDSIAWKRAGSEQFTDVTDAVDRAVLSATPHPDDEIDNPKGYSVELILSPDSTTFASELQEALMDLDPAIVRLRLADAGESTSDVPVGVSKVPHLPDQKQAELSVKPEAHATFHDYF